MNELDTLIEKFKKDIDGSDTLDFLKELQKKYLGKDGELSRSLSSLKDFSADQKVKLGKKINDLKKEISEELEIKEAQIKNKVREVKEKNEWLDISIPGNKPKVGNLHPITITKRKIEEIFTGMGFSVVEGPLVETEYYNFDALNIPKDHPARDMWDTFWLKNGMLLRTHTSPVQIRYMKENKAPLRIIAPGKVFRHEATDACHEFDFNQVEGLMIGKDISVANFKGIIEEFLSKFFGKDVKVRLRPSFFPFTEPSFEIDMFCINCGGKGCSTCQKTGWIELMGAGMVHPKVLKEGGIDPKIYQGFAFGVGIDRLALMRYKINDIRYFNSGDLKFLKQF
jgi:phenylalanyl-tRNA synthetase alpha chain